MQLQSLPLLLAAASCLIASASCWPAYHCDSPGRRRIADERFDIVTRNRSDSVYRQGSVCDFGTLAPNSSVMYFVEVLDDTLAGETTIDISSGHAELFRGSSLQQHEKALMTFGPQLNVTLDASDDLAVPAAGVRLRVRMWPAQGCPPGWTAVRQSGAVFCFGTSTYTGVLTFADAQKSCNRMRANLLQLPPWLDDDADRMQRLLPTYLEQGGWVGLTDLRLRHQYRWLDGSCFSRPRQITCQGSWYSSCRSDYRCATFSRRSDYALEMWNCNTRRNYVCSMPAGGTSNFFAVPHATYVLRMWPYFTWGWTMLVMGLICLVALMAGLGIRKRRLRNQTRPSAQDGEQADASRVYTIHGSKLRPPPYQAEEPPTARQ